MKYKKFIKFLLVANIVLLAVVAIFMRVHKLQQQDKKFLALADKFASGISDEGALSKKDALEGMLLSEHMGRNHQISDADLATLLSLIKRGFAKDRSGNSLIDFGDGFDKKLVVNEPQKQAIGQVCLLVAQEATEDDCRVYALQTILMMHIRSLRPSLAPFANDKNPKIADLARRMTNPSANVAVTESRDP